MLKLTDWQTPGMAARYRDIISEMAMLGIEVEPSDVKASQSFTTPLSLDVSEQLFTDDSARRVDHVTQP